MRTGEESGPGILLPAEPELPDAVLSRMRPMRTQSVGGEADLLAHGLLHDAANSG
jgi:hypothetical protein